MSEYTYQIEPAGFAFLWFAVPIAVLLTALLIFIISTLYFSRNTVVTVSNAYIKIDGGFYGKNIPIATLQIEDAKIVNLLDEKEYDLKMKAFGVGISGYYSGWYNLNNGEKGFVNITKKRSVLYLPTTNEYTLLLSLKNTQDFIRRIRASQARIHS